MKLEQVDNFLKTVFCYNMMAIIGHCIRIDILVGCFIFVVAAMFICLCVVATKKIFIVIEKK